MPTYGAHEVVIESAAHVIESAALSGTQLERVLQAYRSRIVALRREGTWKYVLIYKNQGYDAGATLAHVHSQIVALPDVPREPAAEYQSAQDYCASNGRCVYCAIVRNERDEGVRIIAENEDFVVFCPFASRVAGESWIMPKAHVSSFDSRDSDPGSLSSALLDLLRRFAKCFEGPSFNYFIHNNPLTEPENPFFHWHLELLPRLQHVAAFEWGSGLYMNSMAPEDAARRLREVRL
jgi:UDPglucose--hexose-1-phosphate uridylyltransferase